MRRVLILSLLHCNPGWGPAARPAKPGFPSALRAGGGAAGPLQLRTDPAFAHTEGNGFARHPFAALSPAACTRAQCVTFLFRGAIPNGLEAVTLQDLISGFSDAASLPGYAMPAMNWALANEIVQGNGGALMPNGTCTRAQIVTFLYRANQSK